MTRIHHYYVQRARNLCLFYARTGTASLHLGALIRFIKFYDAYRGIKYFKYAAVVLSLGLLVIRRCGFPADIVISFYPNAFVVLVYPTEEDHCLDLFKLPVAKMPPVYHSSEKNIDLSKYFQMPEKEVAKKLGMCLTSLKKICRQNGINRWPYRKVRCPPC